MAAAEHPTANGGRQSTRALRMQDPLGLKFSREEVWGSVWDPLAKLEDAAVAWMLEHKWMGTPPLGGWQWFPSEEGPGAWLTQKILTLIVCAE